MRKRTIVAIGAALAAVAASVPATADTAKAPVVSPPIASGLAGPLQIDVNRHGIAVGQGFSLTVSKIRDNGSVNNLVTEPGNPNNRDVAGVLLTRRGVFYTYSQFKQQKSWLKFVSNDGRTHNVANLWEFEESRNPDHVTTYGFPNLSQSCADQVTEEMEPGGGEPYTGLVDSHPYAIAKAPGGGWYIAEAAGNDILKVSRSGNVRSVAILKPQAVTITAQAAAANGLPGCVAGERYRTEPVPTDVEVQDNGKLVVSLLPGGPEDESLGARGKVVRVNPRTGTSRDLTGGIAGATNVAISGGDRVYVTNLFGDSISKLDIGGTAHFVDVTQPAALEWYRGKLYVGNNAFGNGSIVKVH